MTGDPQRPLLARILGRAFDDLPETVRNAHAVNDCRVLQGRVQVDGAEIRIGRFVARLVGFPRQTHDAPITVEMRRDGDGEVWTRRIGGRQFVSQLGACPVEPGRGIERFGPFTFVIDYAGGSDGLDLTVIGASVGRLRLPRSLAPRARASERIDARGRFAFDVSIELPGVGRLVRYRGWLAAKP
jgi:hypothetical protein